MPNILKVPKDIVMEEWDLPYGGNPEQDVEVICKTVVGKARWTITYELLVKIKDKFYKTYFDCGATEYQDNGPWEFDNEVKFTEVRPVEKITIVYEEVP